MAATLKLLKAIGSPQKGDAPSTRTYFSIIKLFTDYIWLENGQWTGPLDILWQSVLHLQNTESIKKIITNHCLMSTFQNVIYFFYS